MALSEERPRERRKEKRVTVRLPPDESRPTVRMPSEKQLHQLLEARKERAIMQLDDLQQCYLKMRVSKTLVGRDTRAWSRL